jgi:anaerobic ribonucleoside-triphosphate reductase
MKQRYYDYRIIDGYNAPLRVIVGGRRLGKTFGCKRKVIEGFIEHGHRFVWIVENTVLQDRLQCNNGDLFFNNIVKYYNEYPNKRNIKIMSKLNNYRVDENIILKDKSGVVVKAGAIHINGVIAGYIIALSDFAKVKSNDFNEIKYFIFDEFIAEVLDKKTRDNPHKFISILESVLREHSSTIYMLSNTTNITDELAVRLGIDKQKKGTIRKIYDDIGLIAVVHLVDKDEYIEHMDEVNKSVSGRVASLLNEDRLHFNEFEKNQINLIRGGMGQFNRMYMLNIEGNLIELGRAGEAYYFRRGGQTTNPIIYNNFIFGEDNIKNNVRTILTVFKTYFDTYTTASLIYSAAGLNIKKS